MASSSSSSSSSSSYVVISFAILACTLSLTTGTSSAQLTPNFYTKTCPQVLEIVASVIRSVVSKEKRMGASLLRLQFHDCFVNGCDASILLDDTSSFTGEKTAVPNKNSVRGYNVIDDIKSKLEKACPGVVSCADIIAISARESVNVLGGPSWKVKLGRRDSTSASLYAANGGGLPPPVTLNDFINRYQAVGLSAKDLVVLSGAHTVGQARCTTFKAHVYNDTNIDASFGKLRRSNCPLPAGSGDNNLAPLDVKSPNSFDNSYYKNLISQKGLLRTDQQLYSGGSTDSLVEKYSKDAGSFYVDFVDSMLKMGDIRPLTGSNGEIRKNCRKVNS